jgi:hypothetical protein
MTHEQKQAMSHADEDIKPRVRPPSVQAAYLLERVRKMESEEAGVVEAARLKHRQRVAEQQEKVDELAAKENDVAHLAHATHRVRIDVLVRKYPADVQELYFALARAGKGEE